MANNITVNREVGNIISKLVDMAKKIQELKENADQIITISTTMGETARNYVETQLRDYFIPTLDKLGWGGEDNTEAQGSIYKIAQFLGNCTYAQVSNNDFLNTIETIRQDVANYRTDAVGSIPVEDMANSDVYVPGTGSSEDVAGIPQGMSYVNNQANEVQEPVVESPAVPEQGAAPISESVENKTERLKEYAIYQVVRSSDIRTSLSEELSKVRDIVVSEFDNKEDAEATAERLNKTITPAEKELLKVEYKVNEIEH